MNRLEPVATLISVYRNDSATAFAAALESVLGQALDGARPHHIYLGVDGALPADLETAVAAFSHRLHRVHRNDHNRGLAATLNSLIALLQDEAFVFRMDADDTSLPGRYQAQLDHMAAFPEVDILGTAIVETDQSTGEQRLVRFARDHANAVAAIHRRVPVAHPTVCFRRRVFQTLPGYPESGTNEDIALWFLCLRNGLQFANLEQPYLLFTISDRFWQRRGLHKAWGEMTCYLSGIYGLHGLFTTRYAFPVLRFLMRLSPARLSQWLYRSRWRQNLAG